MFIPASQSFLSCYYETIGVYIWFVTSFRLMLAASLDTYLSDDRRSFSIVPSDVGILHLIRQVKRQENTVLN